MARDSGGGDRDVVGFSMNGSGFPGQSLDPLKLSPSCLHITLSSRSHISLFRLLL